MRIPSKAEPGQVCRPAPTWFYAFVPHKLGSGLTSTLLPLFVVQVVGGNVTDVGWVTSLAALVAVPASIWWGNLSDRLRRRRPFIILGFLGFTVSLLLIALGRSVPQVLAVSTFGALLTTAIEPAASALVLDQTTEDQWPECLGRLNQVSGWSFVAGLMVGMIWMTLLPRYWGTVTAMRALFLVAGGITSLSLIFTSVWLPEPPLVRTRRVFRPELIGRLTVAVVEKAMLYPPRLRYFVLRPTFLIEAQKHLSNTLVRYYLCSLLMFFAFHVGFVPFPIFLTDALGATSAQVFFISLLKSATDSLLYVPMGRIVQKRRGLGIQAQATAVRVGIFGFFSMLGFIQPGPVGLVPLALVHTLTGITWAAIAVSGTTAVATMAPKGLEGRALGLYNAVIGTSGVVGSLAGGYLAKAFGYGVSFATAALLASLAAVWFWRLRVAVLTRTQEGSVTG